MADSLTDALIQQQQDWDLQLKPDKKAEYSFFSFQCGKFSNKQIVASGSMKGSIIPEGRAVASSQ